MFSLSKFYVGKKERTQSKTSNKLFVVLRSVESMSYGSKTLRRRLDRYRGPVYGRD